MPDLILWGATGQAKVLYEAIIDSDMRLVALVDNRNIPSPIQNIPILFGEDGLDEWLTRRDSRGDLCGSVAIGGNKGTERLMIIDQLKLRRIQIITIIHPMAFVAKTSEIGEGCQILAGSAVCACAKLGRAVIINTLASVDHDTVIGDGVHIGPGATLAGEITVESGVFIGAGAIILPRLTIGKNAVVGAGAVVTKDVTANVTVVGVPAHTLSEARR